MKAILLIGEHPNQFALAHKLSRVINLSAIVVSQNIPRRKPSRFKNLFSRVGARLAASEFRDVWFEMMNEYGREYPKLPDVPRVDVENVNDEGTLKAIEKYQPDFIIVSGTNLVGKRIIESGKVLNLHTGISPYVKGAPNCTNWCLANKEFHLIGNTVMWIDVGIDSGAIITTERTPLDGEETLFELHWKVMQHAHNLYVRAVEKLAKDESVPNVPQDSIGKGKLYLTKDWNAIKARAALKNFNNYYREWFTTRHAPDIKLVKL